MFLMMRDDENRLDNSGGVCILAGNTEREK